MGKLGHLTLKVEMDAFLTNPRLRLCKNGECKFNGYKIGDLNCNLRSIELDQKGMCMQFEKRSNK